MPIEVLMPALSPTMEEGNLAKWLVKEGDTVSSGDLLAEIETDKATMEVEAVEEGKVGKLLVAEGTEGVKVNEPIALLLEEGEDESDLDSYSTDGGGAKSAQSDEEDDSSDSDQDDGEAEDESADAAPEPVRHAKPAASDPEIPDGTDMVPTTVRDALRDAMAEEMRRDDTVFVVHDLQLRHAGDRPHHQLGREDPLHVRRPDGLPDGVPRPERRGVSRGRPAQSGLFGLVCVCARPESDRAL